MAESLTKNFHYSDKKFSQARQIFVKPVKNFCQRFQTEPAAITSANANRFMNFCQ